MELKLITIDKPDDLNFILGQTHFIKSVEDIHEALVQAVPGIKFGLAFCEASGPTLVRVSGTDESLIDLAQKNAMALGSGHSFIVMLGDGFFPLNVLNAIKMVPEVCRIFCATANPTQVVVAKSEQGCGILGVIDGFSPPLDRDYHARIYAATGALGLLTAFRISRFWLTRRRLGTAIY